ncbi:MAG: SIMPL domain-containing protein [Salibacteraceae bacterium]
MRLKIGILVLMLGLSSLYIQAQNKKGVIQVYGYSQMSISPDQVIFNLNIDATNKDFSVALDELNTQVNKLKKSLAASGITESDISTTNYNIREENKYESGKQVFVGFKASHGLQVKTVFNENNLKDVYAAIKESGVEANMQMSFGLSNPQQYKNDLIAQAVEDAFEKAKTLSQAGGVSLGGIKKMSYGMPNRVLPIRNYSEMQVRAVSSDANISVNPGNLILSEKVDVIYFILNQ